MLTGLMYRWIMLMYSGDPSHRQKSSLAELAMSPPPRAANTAAPAARPAPARLRQLTDLPKPGVQSAFSWSPCGEHLAFVHDGSVCLLTVPRAMMGGDGNEEDEDPDDMMAQLMEQTNAVGGPEDRGRKRRVRRLTRRRTGDAAPAPRGVTFSPCGKYVAYVRRERASHGTRGGQQAQTPGSPGSASPKSPLDSEKGKNDDPFYNSDDENEGSTKYFNQVCVVGVEVVLRQPFRLAAQVIGTGATVLGGLIATDLAKTGVGAIVDGLRHRRQPPGIHLAHGRVSRTRGEGPDDRTDALLLRGRRAAHDGSWGAAALVAVAPLPVEHGRASRRDRTFVLSMSP